MKRRELTGIIPFTYFSGFNKAVGSTFLRVDQLVSNSLEYEVWQHGKLYDNLIFQKVYWKEMMTTFDGPKILDLCDPDWLNGSLDIIDIGNSVDAITCSSEELTKLIRTYFPFKIIEHIPDRLDFTRFPKSRVPHTQRAKTVIWFGFVHNAHETLMQLYPALVKHNLQLTIIADKPYIKDDKIKEMNTKFIRFNNQTILTTLKEADIILNPKSEKARFKYKSNNKTIISLKLGIPVATSVEDIERLLDPHERNKDVEIGKRQIESDYDILKSIEQYNRVISAIKNSSHSALPGNDKISPL